MEELLKNLEILYSANLPLEADPDNPDDHYLYFPAGDVRYDTVVGLCCDYLITNEGGCNWRNIDILRRNGYRVWAGDKDSFGWLVGCIRKMGHQGVVCYG